MYNRLACNVLLRAFRDRKVGGEGEGERGKAF